MPRRSPRRKARRRPALRKHHLTVLVIVIPTLLFLFLLPLLLLQHSLDKLEREYERLGAEHRELLKREAFYREAYETALGDLRVLSTAYGGDDEYAVLAQRLREEERSLLGGSTDEELYEVRNPELWDEYREQGIIRSECLAPLVVNATSDELLFSIRILEGSAGLYLDGNYQRELGNGTYGLRLRVPPGVHELSLVSSTGFRYDAARLEGVPVPPTPRYDRGTTWLIFDCLDVSASSEGPGALRIPFRVV